MQLAITTRNLSKQYGTVIALDNVSLDVNQGELFGFLGPNGAGKSTFVKILLGLVRHNSGEARIFGIPANRLQARRSIGYLPENMRAYDFLTVEEFMRFHARLAGIETGNIKRETDRCLGALGMTPQRSRKISTLSKGMLQRVGIAQAMLGNPELLILDEPASGLDPIGLTDVRNLLLELHRLGTTIFLNSHLLSEVERTCSRIAILHQGKVIKIGRTGDVSDKQRHLEIAAEGLTDAVLERMTPLCDRPPQRSGTVVRAYPRTPHDAAALHRLLVEQGCSVLSLRWQSESLEELFYRLIKNEVSDRSHHQH